jgi:cytochrome P450
VTQTQDPGTTLDPFAARGPEERQRILAELARVGGPVQRWTFPMGMEGWLVLGYAEARAAMGDPRLVKTMSPTGRLAQQLEPEAWESLRYHLLMCDGAEHTRMRRLVNAAFTRRRIDGLVPRTQEIADDLLDAMEAAALAGTDVVDLLDAYAFPLPMTVISELLGVPEELRPRFRQTAITLINGVFSRQEEFAAAIREQVAVATTLVEHKRREPGDDLLSALVAVRDGSDHLSENELTSMVFLLVTAGHETTVNLIGNSMYALLTRPDQLAALQAMPDLLPDAIEELLRYDGPVQTTFVLRATERLQVGPVTVEKDEIVVPFLLAANRDPAQHEDADVLDVTREYTPHLGFGHGIHHCLGAPLARMEARIALSSLLDRFPRLRLAQPAEDYRRRPNMLINGFTSLPVRLR